MWDLSNAEFGFRTKLLNAIANEVLIEDPLKRDSLFKRVSILKRVSAGLNFRKNLMMREGDYEMFDIYRN